MAEQPLPKRMRNFVCFHLADKHAFAPFTGQDFSAWCAFLYAAELYGRGDRQGQDQALISMAALVRGAQQKNDVLACFKKAIPGVLDWGFEVKVWGRVAPRAHHDPRFAQEFQTTRSIPSELLGLPMSMGDDAGLITLVWPCTDGERICSHIHSKPSKRHAGWFDCKDCKTTWKLGDDGGSAVCPL